MRAHQIQSLNEINNVSLLEILDHPYPVSNNTPLAIAVAAAVRKKYGSALTGLHVYARTDTTASDYHADVFTVMRHQGLWEVHHTNYDDPTQPLSGQVLGLRDGANPRFMSTILQLYMRKINKGIRVVATPSMMPTYLAVLQRLIKRSAGTHKLSDVDTEYKGIDGVTYNAVTIREHAKSITPALNIIFD